MTSPLLQVTSVTKSFGASRALQGVSFELARGEVHGLVGENGAGKSTLMKILSGAIRPDSGSMALEGSPYAPRGPRDALARGVAMIYQELALAPHLSVEANVMLGNETTVAGLLRRGLHRRKVQEALDFLDHPEISPGRRVGTLGPAARQLVEVARALVRESRVLILDEPTSSLSENDKLGLFKVIRRLREKGIGVIYISHFLEEIAEITQRYTVLRDGRDVANGTSPGLDRRRVVEEMVGRKVDEVFHKSKRSPGEVVLTVAGLRACNSLSSPADLEVRRGEVLGIAGLVGSGRTELLRAIYRLDRVASGEIILKGVARPLSDGPRRMIDRGVGFVSEDRKGEGLALGRSIEDNLTYPALHRHSRFGWLDLRGRRREAGHFIRAVNVRCRDSAQTVGELSGGNQQKVAIARLFHQKADVLLLDDPTRGIDVAAKAEVYRLIDEKTTEGAAVVVVSSYLPELFGICDRIAVMSRGSLTELRPTADWTEQTVMIAATAI